MDNKLKVLWNLDVLVKMCRLKSDGPSLRVEELEITKQLEDFQQEINDIKSISDEESYDSSAEMADRNIEIITKKQLQTLTTSLKEKNKELNELKAEEKKAYESTSLLRETQESYEKYIFSMQDRISSVTDPDTINRYNDLINDTINKKESLIDELSEKSQDYEKIQNDIIALTDEINKLEDKIDKKRKLLTETQTNLGNKENYIDKTKKEKNNKRIAELEEQVEKINNRLEEIRKDPKYIETKIKDIINSDADPINAKPYLVDLINIVIRQPYINAPDDNKLEEELLKATQARDAFASEIDKKTYNILEANTPEKTRISFLETRIKKWQNEYEELQAKVSVVDQDQQFNYKEKEQQLSEMINIMQADLLEYEKAYQGTPDSNISLKASLKVSLDEKRDDIIEAEKIAAAFRRDEAEDIQEASHTIKVDCEKLNENILNAQKEIEKIRDRLLAKKSGLIDISSRNRDKEVLKDLAQTVIDLKHRRQFPETPIDVIKRLEEQLGITLTDSIDLNYIDETKEIESKDYNQYLTSESPKITTIQEDDVQELKRGIRVLTEDAIEQPETPPVEAEIPSYNDEPQTYDEEPPVYDEEPQTDEETNQNPDIIVDDNTFESLETPDQVDNIDDNTANLYEKVNVNDEKSDNIDENEAIANELDKYIEQIHQEN